MPRTLASPVPWSEIPVFQGLGPRDRAGLQDLSLLRGYEAGERLFEQGQPSEFLHFLVSGSVKVVKGRPDGQEVILEILGPGDPVGVVAALEGFPFPAAAVAREDCRVLTLPRRQFLAFLESNPMVVRGLLAGFCRRGMELIHRLADFPGTVASRIARLLEMLALRFGVEEDGGVRIPLGLSRQEIADLAGTSLETAIRILSRWGKERVVVTDREGFFVPDMQVLRRQVEG